MSRLGRILEVDRDTPNVFSIENDICKIQIYDKNHKFKCQAIIDTEDYEKVKDYKWHTKPDNYVTNGKIGSLSRIVMNVTDKSIEVDHINHDKLDNRKENLRICRHNGNGKNQQIPKNNTSGHKGVIKAQTEGKWIAQIRANGQLHYLGTFNTKEEAAKAYNKAAKRLHGEFACLNET